MDHRAFRAHHSVRSSASSWIDLVSVSPSIPKRFAAMPPEEAIARLRVHGDRDADYALGNLPAIHNGRMKAGQVVKN